jgi:hypothetical protein
MASKVMHGARAVLNIGGQTMGIFTDCSWSVGFDVQVPYILGRFAGDSTVYVGAEPVQLSVSGYRVMNHGPQTFCPKIQDLIDNEDITISLYDRNDPNPASGLIMEVQQCKVVSHSGQTSSRTLQGVSVTFQGIFYSDESGESAETATATSIPVP